VSRLHPFQSFAEIAERWFGAIRTEATAQHRDPRDRVQFEAIPAVQRALHDIEDPSLLESTPMAAAGYLAALFAAFTYWNGGQETVRPTKQSMERLFAAPERWSLAPAEDRDVYVQLPEHWFWSRIGEDAPHEPIDGMFVSANRTRGELSVLAVLGLRNDRDDFSQISVTGAFAALPHVAGALRRPLFAPVVDGGEAAGLLSVITTGETLALALMGLATRQIAHPSSASL
jgi:hypothetical protein